MKVKCINSACNWFTQGREYAAQVDSEHTIAILQDDMCSDLTDNNDAWYAERIGQLCKINGVAMFEVIP